jgi:hypothetical protein
MQLFEPELGRESGQLPTVSGGALVVATTTPADERRPDPVPPPTPLGSLSTEMPVTRFHWNALDAQP